MSKHPPYIWALRSLAFPLFLLRRLTFSFVLVKEVTIKRESRRSVVYIFSAKLASIKPPVIRGNRTSVWAQYTIKVDNNVYKLNLLPSGIINNKTCAIGNGVVLIRGH